MEWTTCNINGLTGGPFPLHGLCQVHTGSSRSFRKRKAVRFERGPARCRQARTLLQMVAS